MKLWPFFLEDCKMLPENVSTDIQSIFTTETLHILHLRISKHIKDALIASLSPEYILSHPVIPCLKRNLFRSSRMPMFRASNYLLE